MLQDEYIALYNLLYSMGDTATDIHWGSAPNPTSDDCTILEKGDLEKAFKSACAEMVYELISSDEYMALPARLADYYGRHVRVVYSQRVLRARLVAAEDANKDNITNNNQLR